jgi:multiple sugar transport system substrate-binding protein
MEELKLSIMSHGYDPAGDLRQVLEPFEAEHQCRVHVTVFPWERAWSELVRVALHQTDVHVSEIGANWVGNLVDMNALRPFQETELAATGGAPAFLPAAWHSATLVGDEQVWAVPWLADTRLVYYRRDLLREAGVDEATAFQAPDQFAQTLDRLQASGVAMPWVVPTKSARRTLHNLASWVWRQGGGFVSADGTCTLLNEPETRAGVHAYLKLHRYLAPAARGLSSRQSDGLFQEEAPAVTISGPWLFLLPQVQEQAIPNIGLALPPGPPFVGGSNLVIWRHTLRHERLAVELVRFLTSYEAQAAYCQYAGLLPVRLDVLASSPFVDQPRHQVMARGLKSGRSFPALSTWGLVEDWLTAALARLWEDLLADPHLDLEVAIAERFKRLADRLDPVLFRSQIALPS